MKVERLEIDSFLGIKTARLDFEQINIIAGENWSGKSSVQQGLRVALTGEIARVKLKGQYGLLVHEGSKAAKVTAYLEGGEVNDVLIPVTGKSQIPNCDDVMLKIALDQQRFVSMTEAERRKVLFDANANLFNAVKVKVRMAELGADMVLAEQIIPLLNNSFDAAFSEAENKAKESRALWKSVTGETYGSDKAAEWVYVANVEELQKQAGTYSRIATERNGVEKQIADQQVIYDAARDALIACSLNYTCSSCGHAHSPDAPAVGVASALTKAEGATLNFMEAALAKLNSDIHAADLAAVELKTAQEDAKAVSEEALKHHANVVAWSHIKELMSESGIMSELVADALKPLNKRLKHSSTISAFGQVAISHDMSITVDNRLYGLCSEAQQWLAQAMICEAIAYIAGLNIVILDRIDVLSVANRGKLIAWCFELGDDVQFILFGTLKSKPELKGAVSFWVQDGEVQS